MTAAQEALVAVSAALAAGDADALEAALRRALAVAEPLAVEETLLQSYLFLGYPSALRGLGVWRRVSGLPAPAAAAGAAEQAERPERPERAKRGAWAEWAERGAATCRRVYSGQYDRLRDNIRALHPDMEEWMVVEGYGKVLGRPGLELATRELCIVALLAHQDAGPQLYSHLRGALHAGAPVAAVEATIELLRPALPAARRETLMQQWLAVRQRRDTVEN
jgi:4-carboxymuconolactone decarboxylase